MKNIKKKYLVVICAALLMCALFSTAVSAENKYTEQSGDTSVTGLKWSITPIESSTWEASLTLSGEVTSTPNYKPIALTGLTANSGTAGIWDIAEVVIKAPLTTLGAQAFKGYSDMSKLTIPSTLTTLGPWEVFYNAGKLTTVAVDGTTAKDGVIDLRNITTYGDTGTFSGAFASVSPTIYFADEFEISGGKTYFTYFGSSQCEKITVYCKKGSSGETILKNTKDNLDSHSAQSVEIKYYAEKPDSGITMEGYAVRVSDYNGLRGIFSFDGDSIEANAAKGYTLVKYGTLLASEENAADGLTLENANTNPKIKERTIRSGNEYVGKLLKAPVGDSAEFAVSLVGYPTGEGVDLDSSHIRDNVRMAGYSVWRHEDGTEYTCYVYYKDDPNYSISLYDAALYAYKLGIINDNNTDDAVVYDILKLYAPEGYADVTTTTSEGADNFTYTLVPNDTENTTYTAIVRANGRVYAPKETLYGGYPVNYIVLDYGITDLDQGIFIRVGTDSNGWTEIRTVVYPETLVSINKNAFTCANTYSYVKTIFKAGNEAVENLWDLSGIDSVNISGTLQRMQAQARVCLPASVNDLDEIPGWAFSNTLKCTGIYIVGEEYKENTVNLGNAKFTKVGSGAFTYLGDSTINTIILPTTITDVSENAFNNNTAALTVKTETKVDAIATVIAGLDSSAYVSYTNLSGEAFQ